MKKIILTIALFHILIFAAAAQDFPYGEYTANDLDMKRYEKDTSAHAVVLNEYGKARIDVTSDDRIKLILNYHVKIKIFDSKGFDNGTMSVLLYNGDDATDEVTNIIGTTTYKNEDGSTQTVELDAKNIYPVKQNKYYSTVKFAMPGLRAGCVIDLKYTLLSPFFHYKFHTWEFQSRIPKVYSEYDMYIPGFWTYNASLRGPLSVTKNISEIEPDCFATHGGKSACAHLIYGIKDIPAFVEEDYMTAPKNFMSALYFQLADYTSPYDGTKSKIANDWGTVDRDLKNEDYFGGQLKRTSLLKQRLLPVIPGNSDDLTKAKAVYEYVKKNIKWNEFTSLGSEDGIRKALDTHSGNVGDINLCLVTALSAMGINSQAVLLSTRDHGLVNQLYPAVEEFNYIIAKADIGDKTYYLDATDPLLPFGMLPMRCLNGQGRVMCLDKPSYWVDMNNGQKENNTYNFDLTLQSDGKIKGTVTHYSMGYAAYLKRMAIKKFNTIDEYVESIDETSSRMKILRSNITGLDSLDMPLTESYDVEINAYNKLSNRLSFNPFILDKRTINPFKLADRAYPVDWGMPSNTRFILTMHLPEQYTIESTPKPVGISLPNDGGNFITNFDNDGNTFTFSHVTQFKRSVYSSEEYPYLKELYNQIILSERADIVFTKK